MNNQAVRNGVLRFWRLIKLQEPKEGEEPDPDSEELWVLRLGTNQAASRLSSALNFLHSHDILSKALHAEFRQDRAPKGGLQKQLEGLISSNNPKGSKNGQKQNGTKAALFGEVAEGEQDW